MLQPGVVGDPLLSFENKLIHIYLSNLEILGNLISSLSHNNLMTVNSNFEAAHDSPPQEGSFHYTPLRDPIWTPVWS